MAGQYNKPVQCGRESAHKSRATSGNSTLVTACGGINTFWENISKVWEKSAVADSAMP